MSLLKSVYTNLIVSKSKVHYRLRHLLKTFSLDGIKLTISDDKILSEFVLLSLLQGGYEDKEHKVIKEKMEASDVVLELGAGMGFNSITAAKINGGKIVSYEANPALIPLIKRNQQLNEISFEIRNKILLSQRPVSSSALFHVGKNFNTSSLKDYMMGDHSVTETIQVETAYLGDVLTELSPTFLIVDIEGAEADFFSKPDILLHSSVQKILVDLHPWVIGNDGCSEVVRNIMDAGFSMDSEWCNNSIFYFSRK